jgi:two-component system, NarL family, sensor kinase
MSPGVAPRVDNADPDEGRSIGVFTSRSGKLRRRTAKLVLASNGNTDRDPRFVNRLVRTEIGRYFLLSLFGLLLVVLALGRVSRRIGTSQAINDAKQTVSVIARTTIEPDLTSDMLTGLSSTNEMTKATAVDQMNELAERARRSGVLVRLKLWDSTGGLIYADDPRLIGAKDRLGDDELVALLQGAGTAEVSDLNKPENRFERGQGQLLEVYLPLRGPNGELVLFESYLPYAEVVASRRRVLLEFVSPMVLGVLLVQGIGLALMWSLARRLGRAQQQRELLLHHAVASSDAERRRIAADLHDGVVQDLTGVTLTLAAVRRRNIAQTPPDRALLKSSEPLAQSVEEQIREAINALRSLIVDIYPPNLRSEGLVSAVRSLCSKAHNRGLTTDLNADVDEALLSDQSAALCYRVVQESLRNVSTHAEATHIDIGLQLRSNQLTATVQDNGIGFDVRDVADRIDEGHVGLRGLGDLVAEQGGSLKLRSSPGRGTVVLFALPADFDGRNERRRN